jgi:hypothetical protein
MRVLFVAMLVSSMWMTGVTRSTRIPPSVHIRIALHGTGPDVRMLPGEPPSIIWRWRRSGRAAALPLTAAGDDGKPVISVNIAYDQTD